MRTPLTRSPTVPAGGSTPGGVAIDLSSGRARTAAGMVTALLLATLVVVVLLTVRADLMYSDPEGLSWWYAAAWGIFGAAAFTVRRASPRAAVALVLAGGVAVSAAGLAAPPRTSTDAYRYAWDGRVQAAGVSPYDHAPADPVLAALRDGWLFPTGSVCGERTSARLPAGDGEGGCTRINRPRVHTIYPPVAEGYFLSVHALSPDGARHKPFQVGGALLAVGTTVALLLVLRRRGDPARAASRAALWAWCPAVPLEAVNNAHVDVLGALLVVLGLAASPARKVLGGGLVGGAVATKLLPGVVLPGALSGLLAPGGRSASARAREAVAVLLPAGLVVAVAYLPYALASRSSVFGYLSGYLAEEGYDDAAVKNRYALLRLVVPESWALPVLLLALLLVVWWVLRHGDPRRPWRAALLVTGVALLLLTPGYSWYALLVVALVALDGRWEWLGVAMAGAAQYVTNRMVADDVPGTAGYASAAGLVLAGWLVRNRPWRRWRAIARPATARPRRTSAR